MCEFQFRNNFNYKSNTSWVPVIKYSSMRKTKQLILMHSFKKYEARYQSHVNMLHEIIALLLKTKKGFESVGLFFICANLFNIHLNRKELLLQPSCYNLTFPRKGTKQSGFTETE